MTITVQERRDAVGAEQPTPSVRRWDSAVVGLIAAALSAAGAARPSLWFDEAATISAGTRSIPELWRMVANIDAVHGLYYLMMHAWFAIFPATEFLCRVSSAVTVGVSAAGVVVLGRRLAGTSPRARSIAVTGGLVFALIPRVTWAGMETRSYAATMAAAVWLTVFCLFALRRDRWAWWSVYAVLIALSTLLNVFLVLLVPVHSVVAVTCGPAIRDRHGRLVRWSVAACAGLAAVVPFLVFCQTQLFQVGWISPLSVDTIGMIAQEQYFDHAWPFAYLAGAIAFAAVVVRTRRFRQPTAGRRSAPPSARGRLVVVTLSWITIPTAILVAYSAVQHPIYYPRYLSFTAPALALLLGLCIVTVGRERRWIAVILVLFAAAAAPNYLAQRGPYAKERMDYSQVADVIDRYAAPGDCLILDNSAAWAPGPIRPLTAARPSVYRKLHDYGRGLTAVQRNRLWDSHIAIWAWADKIPDCPVLWTVSERDPTLPEHQRGPALDPGPRLRRAMAYQVPSRFGFRVVERWQFSFAQVAKSTR